MIGYSLRTKILLSVGCIIFVVLAGSTFLHIRDLRAYYLEAFEWRAEGVAQGLLNTIESLKNYNPQYAENVPVLLEKLNLHCERLYELNKDKQIAFLSIVNADGVIAAHNEKSLLQTPVSPRLLTALEQKTQQIVLDAELYHVLIPIKDDNELVLGTIDIGIPKKLVTARERSALKDALLLFLVYLFVAVLAITVLMRILVLKPLSILVEVGKQLARGELISPTGEDDLETALQQISSRDEIGVLNQVFRDMTESLQEIAEIATKISLGDLHQSITPKSSRDILGKAFSEMIEYLHAMAHSAADISEGNLQSRIQLRSDSDHLGTEFLRMQNGLSTLIAKVRTRADDMALISANVETISLKNSQAFERIGETAEETSQAMQQVNVNAREVWGNAEHLASNMKETSSSVNQMLSSMTQVAKHSRSLSQFADTTLTSVAEIMNSLDHIAGQAERSRIMSESTTQKSHSGQESVQQVTQSMLAISQVTERLSQIILRLQQRSSEIGTVLDVINDIAEQTSLLALNASIIAAQAGSHGRGFAVVANEIKELATRVTSSTKEIAGIVRAVQHDSTDAVKVIDEGQREVGKGVEVAHNAGGALEQIGQSAESSSSLVTEIATVIRQQATVHSQIATAIQDVAAMIEDINQATQEQERKSSRLSIVVEKMQKLEAQVSHVLEATEAQRKNTDSVTDLMSGVALLVDDNFSTIQALDESAGRLSADADELRERVARFTISLDTGRDNSLAQVKNLSGENSLQSA